MRRWTTGLLTLASMLVFVTRIAAPETGGFATAIALLTGAVLGGLGTISGAVMGAGAAKRFSAVRWGVAGNIVIAWILTLPAAAAIGGLTVFAHAARPTGSR